MFLFSKNMIVYNKVSQKRFVHERIPTFGAGGTVAHRGSDSSVDEIIA